MNILFLDDSPRRASRFRSNWPFAIFATTAQEAITFLQSRDRWDWVLLDHDLGGEELVDSSRLDTGMEVVRWIVANKPDITNIVVHSLNHPASENMVATLTAAGYSAKAIPFINLLD